MLRGYSGLLGTTRNLDNDIFIHRGGHKRVLVYHLLSLLPLRVVIA